MEITNGLSRKNKPKWYGFSHSTKTMTKKEKDSKIPTVVDKETTLSIPKTSNENNNFYTEDKINLQAQPNDVNCIKQIPFRLKLNRRSSSMDDIFLNNGFQRRKFKENSLTLFLRSILSDLKKMNAEQMHQFRVRTLSTIGDILYDTNLSAASSQRLIPQHQQDDKTKTRHVKFKTLSPECNVRPVSILSKKIECCSSTDFSSAEN